MTPDPAPSSTRRKHSRAELAELIALRDRHGLTWRQLSARSGIPVGTLTSWQQKLRKEQTPEPRFLEVETAPSPQPSARDFKLETPSGLRVVVPCDFDAPALRRLLAAVGVAC